MNGKSFIAIIVLIILIGSSISYAIPELTKTDYIEKISKGENIKCGTIEALEAFKRGEKLPRPASGPNYVYSTNFIIHYNISNTTAAYAESVSKYAEFSWAKEVDTLKWIQPPPDGTAGGDSRYDIYIRNLSYLGVTTTESSYPTPYTNGATSYIQVDNSISSSYGWGVLRVTVAHEFNHACQFRYSYIEDTWWYENTATWMEDMVYDNVNDYVSYLEYSSPNPLDSTHLAITDDANLYWYAGAIWTMFLQEYYNDSCPRFCWERMGAISDTNTLSGINDILTSKFSSNLPIALKNYAIWRYFTGTRADVTYHFSESNLWPTSYVLNTHSSYPASGTQSPYEPSGPGGTNFIRFNPGSGGMNITFDGQNGYNWSATAIGYRVPAQSLEQNISLNSNAYGTTNISWSGNSHITLIPVVSSKANNLTHTYSASQVVVKDAGVTQIINPTGIIDSTGSVIPQAKVKNFGTDSVTFQVTFKIGGIYTNSRTKKLNAGVEDTINFLSWIPQRGTFATRCSTYLAGDTTKSNDTLSGSVTVRVSDVGVIAIENPVGTIDSTASVIPRARVKNFGATAETFNVTFKIGSIYTQTRSKTLSAGIEDTINFTAWNVACGTFRTRCSTYLATDDVRTNDTLSVSLTVLRPTPWMLRDSMPKGLSFKGVKSGGALTEGRAGKIYALKGNNTNEFYYYSIGGDSWVRLESLPYDTLKKKRVYKGGALAYNKHSNPDIIYATKGNNTLEFWTYDVDTGIWSMKSYVPYNTIGRVKRVKGGACLAFLKRGSEHYVYLLKGNRTKEFYAYHCQGDTWIKNLQQPCPDITQKPFKDGTCITTGPGDKLYVLKGGAKYNEFYCYDVAADTWVELESVPRYSPLTGKKSKIKDGAALACDDDNFIYAFKGGNRQEFWRYNISLNQWAELETVPRLNKKKVSRGGAMVYSNDKVYALKGNKTFEFWCYTPSASDYQTPKPLVINQTTENNITPTTKPRPQIFISPNPVTRNSAIYLCLDQPVIVRLAMYNNNGQLISEICDRTFSSGTYSLPLDAAGLQVGVYFLKTEIDNKINTLKLIVR